MKPSYDTKLMGIAAVARVLEVSHPTAMRYALERRFRTTRIDGRLFALRSDVIRFKRTRRSSR